MEKSFHQQNSNKSSLKPSSNLSLLSSSFDSFRFVVPKSPFRFGGSGNNNKTTDDERLALVERFVAEGLDVRKWTDSQKLPHVWRWLSDADINCQSLRHQIEKMRHQHGEELHEIEDYIEQVWKLSTERLLMLEEENRHLRHNHSANNSATTTNNNKSAISNQQKQIEDHQYHHRHPSIDYEDDDDEDGDSEIELHKNLCYGFGTADSVSLVNNNNNKSGHVNSLHNNDNKLSHQGHHLVMNSSSSTSSLASSVATGSTGIGNHIVHNNNLCDSLKLRSSKSFGQLTNNGNGNGGLNVDDIHYSSKYSNKNSQNNNSQSIPINNNNNNYCEKCEMLFEDFNKLKSKLSDTIAQLDDVNEKNFILEKLNRCIEIENENFAYKLAESEDRSNQLERRILLLEKECRQLKSKSTSLTSSSNGSMNSNGSTNGPNSLTVDRRLIDELNGKVKSLEEKLDYRFQLYEELEDKYRRQKEKHKETMWKLRHYMEEVKLNPSTSTAASIPEPAKTLSDSCLLQQP